jgi:quercetin dioxygenase-like cupin family protein
MPYEESERSKQGRAQASFYQDALKESAKFRKGYKQRKGVVKAKEMPWEESPQGHLKHVVNEKMDTRECALNIYQQLLPPGGRSGKHRHLAEEVFFVLEGKGYDLHWDVQFDCADKFIWNWETEPKKFEWEEGDYVYIPPYSIHQHLNADPDKPARLISASNRALKLLGFDWQEQIEPAPDYRAKTKAKPARRARRSGTRRSK